VRFWRPVGDDPVLVYDDGTFRTYRDPVAERGKALGQRDGPSYFYVDQFSGQEFSCYGTGDFRVRGITFDSTNVCPGFSGNPGDRSIGVSFIGEQKMSLLDSILGGAQAIGGAVLSGVGAVVQNAPVIIGAAQAIQATQSVLNGSAGGGSVSVMPAAMAAAMMAASGGAATQGSASQEAFAAACRTDPSCTAAIWQALQGGNVTPSMMNGSEITEAQLAAAGIPPALIMALRAGGQGALNTLRSLVPGLAIGGATALGVEALTGLLPSAGGNPKFPRSIFVADPRGGTREYKYRGRPVLYSGDISAARRVVKIAKRARSSRGGIRRRGSASQILMLPAGRVTACGKCGNGSCSGC